MKMQIFKVLKSEILEGNTMIAAASQVFGIENSTKHIIASPYGYISVCKNGNWSDFDWYLDGEEFTFMTAQ
jgi:hypothetical protein